MLLLDDGSIAMYGNTQGMFGLSNTIYTDYPRAISTTANGNYDGTNAVQIGRSSPAANQYFHETFYVILDTGEFMTATS